MGETRTEGRIDCGWGRHGVGFRGDESVELAGAGSVRAAHDQPVASARHPYLEQDPVRRISRQARLRRTLETADERPLAADESLGTRKVPPRYCQALACGQSGHGGIARTPPRG